MIRLADDVSQALMKLVWWILYTAPIGVFGLAAPVTAMLGWDLILSLGVFILSVFGGLAVLMSVVFFPLWYFVAKISPIISTNKPANAILISAIICND